MNSSRPFHTFSLKYRIEVLSEKEFPETSGEPPTKHFSISLLALSDSYKRAIKEQVHGLGLCKVCMRKETSRRLHETKLKANGSLQEKCPYVASQWNHDKNGDLRPSMVASRPSQRVWWTCPNKKCQHKWKTAISNRTGGTMSGCPKCHSGRLKYHSGEQ